MVLCWLVCSSLEGCCLLLWAAAWLTARRLQEVHHMHTDMGLQLRR